MKSIPDFVVLNSEGNNFFPEVKFRANLNWVTKDQYLKHSMEYWQPKLILVVTPESLLDDGCNFESLVTDPDFHVTRTAVESFEPLVERFLVNGKSSANSLPAQECREVKV